jgi:hypothetical protein
MYGNIRMLNREDSVLYFPPEAFGPFKVLHQIGAGALGPVFRAHEPSDEHRDRLVAVKVFRLELTAEQMAASVSEFDALIQKEIDHPNIAAPIAAGVDHGEVYLAQEYAVGESLDVLLRERRHVPIEDVVPIVGGIAQAIDHAAARGVHHGALHMRDIFVTSDAPRVTGFGIVSALSAVGARMPTRPIYSAPDGPSDIYSLAAIAFHALMGRRVSAETLNELKDEYGTATHRAFAAALASDPAARPDRATDFARALAEACGIEFVAAAVVPAFAPLEPEELRRDEPVDEPVPIAATFASEEPVDASADKPVALLAPLAPEDPLDRPVDLGTSRALRFEPAPIELDTASENVLDDGPRRRWAVPVMFVVCALAVVAVVGYLLSSSSANRERGAGAGVDATTVDLPPEAAPRASERERQPQNAPAAPSATPAPTPSRQASGAGRPSVTGSLLIRSTPADAEVLVNGRASGRTPLALRDLALGSYTIQVARDGYAPERRTVEITSRQPSTSTTIELRRAPAVDAAADANAGADGIGGLNVESRPSGARVFVNDRLVGGATPMLISDLPAGPATVRIEMEGYQPWVTTIRVAPDRQTRVAASLERTEIQ